MSLKRFYKVLGILLLVVIICVISMVSNYNKTIEDINLVNDYIEDTTITSILSNNINNKTTKEIKPKENNYLMILEIPKINIKKGIYEKNDKNNNVDKNIMILNQSDMPDKEKGNVILASHNGNSKASFFKHLEDLNLDDLANIYYQGIKYIYQVYKIDIVDKIGTIKVNKNSNYDNLILISCKNGTKDKQIVYMLKCIAKEAY